MPELFPWFLLLHVLGAIIAFGPTFAFPVIGSMGDREPMHANFATRASHTIADRLVEPVAISMLVTGVAMIWSAGINPFVPEYRWLLVAIAIYLVALAFSVLVQRRAVMRLIEMTGGHGGGASAAAPSATPGGAPAGPPAHGAPAGPPPALAATIGSVQRNGMLLAVALVIIVFLMVVKPSLGG